MTRALFALLALGCTYDSHVATSGSDAAIDAQADAQPAPDAGVGTTSSAVLGIALADLDGDGRDDLAVLELLAERARPRLAPRLRLLYGGVDVPPSVEDELDHALLGESFESRVVRDGASAPVDVRGGLAAGDFDGDGVLDLAVALSVEGEGAVHLLAGAPSRALPDRLEALPSLTPHGASVRALGDLDGDGADELWIEACDGRAWIHPGAAPLVDARLDAPSDLGAVFGLGDVDGDGRDDLAIAEPGGVAVYPGPVALPPDGRAPSARIPGPEPASLVAHASGGVVVLWRETGASDRLVAYRLAASEVTEVASLDTGSPGCVLGARERASVVLLGCPGDACEGDACRGALRVLSTPDLTSRRDWSGSPLTVGGDRLGESVALGDFDGDGELDAAFSSRSRGVRLLGAAELP
ncbi:MAG: VCBS repeat-containing protein [Myxococcota bacterium]|nr:VCBS repeat-containing protein [Myxococcota bacterium]